MKIAIATYRELNPLIGGVERISHVLASKWKEQGHEIVAICLQKDGQVEHLADFPEYYLPTPDFLEEIINAQYVEQTLKQEKVDILLNQVVIDPLFARLCCKAARNVGAKVISCMHYDIYQHLKDLENSFFIPEKNGVCLKKWGMDFLLWLRFHLYRKKLLIFDAETIIKQSAEMSDAMVLLSRGAVKRCEQWGDSEKLHYIPNGLELYVGKDSLPQKQKKIIYVGRLEYGLKRVDRFIRIWAEVEKKHSDWSASIVGDGPYRELLEKLASSLGCERLSFEGFQTSEVYYREASILCLTSSSEGMPMVLLESMQYGCVPILFDSFPAASEIVDDGINGCLVKPFDKKAYATKLEMLMNNPHLLEKMVVAAVDKSIQYDINVISAQWIKLFSHLLLEKEK